jgi:hypothetical protein
MNTYERTITDKWNLPLEKAIQVESLSQNLDLFTKKDDIIRELYKYLRNKELVQKVLSKYPFNHFQDKRYQIYINYFIKGERYLIDRKITGNDDIDNQLVFNKLQGYYNYYNMKEQAIEKYQEKLELLKKYPGHYCYLEGSCNILYVKIKLIDTISNFEIASQSIKVEGIK